jgi:hypothetical protein
MDDAALRDYVAAAGRLLGLPLRAQDEAEVLAAFKVLHQQATLVTSFALPGEVEAAPRFTA